MSTSGKNRPHSAPCLKAGASCGHSVSAAHGPAGDKKVVLLVEDALTDAFAIGAMLQDHYQVVHVPHADQILAEVDRVKPSLVLMDIVLPGVSGFQATRLIKKQSPGRTVPVVICSSKEMATDRVWAGRCGADAYLVKPVNKARLLGVVRHLVEGG